MYLRRPRRKFFIESLEGRWLLSASMPMIAYPASAGGPVPLADPFPAGNTSPVGFTPAQITQAYGVDAIRFGSIVGDGSGQTIAIVNAFDNPRLVSSTDPGYANSDLHKFSIAFGLPDPPSFKKVDQNGGTNYPASDSGWANEAALDVEWVHAIAPKANIILVEAKSSALSDLIAAATNYARNQPGVSVVTMSFAAPEAASETNFDTYLTTPAGHAGITFLAATGDTGAPAGYPSYSPNVLSVGGTTLTLSSGNYGSEVGWSGSGGGESQFEPRPNFQNVLDQTGNHRLVPDVALNANTNTGVAVYDSFNGGAAPWYKVGGTSLSTPIWGALIAIANQGRSIQSLGNLDGVSQTLPRLYQLNSGDFHDITSGNNDFAATAGFDLVTGRGTPRANLLVAHLAGGNSVFGTIFNDANGNGSRDGTEPVYAGWGCFLDLNNNGVRDALDIRVLANANGVYSFSDLPGGTYHINQATPAGWKRTNTSITVTVNYGTVVTAKHIAVQELNPAPGSISGLMFNDRNGDGLKQQGEPVLAGWGCFLDFNNDGIFNGSDVRALADENGQYSFNNLAANVTYHVRQKTPTGWKRTSPGGNPFNVPLAGGQTVTVNHANTQASISGTVFNDTNGNGVKDVGETGLFGWGVFIDRDGNRLFSAGDTRVFADENGNYSFFDLFAGTYNINEAVPTGYQRTTPTLAGHTITVTTGQIVTGKLIGNRAM